MTKAEELLRQLRRELEYGDGVYVVDPPAGNSEGNVHLVTLRSQELMLAIDAALAERFDPVADIEAFHERFAQDYKGKPRTLDVALDLFRVKFMEEELREYKSASASAYSALHGGGPPDSLALCLADQLDALVDLVYVALGTAHLQGFDFREAWRRVHAANMQKVRASKESESLRHSTLDVIKPPGWKKPDHLDLVSDHAHKIESGS